MKRKTSSRTIEIGDKCSRDPFEPGKGDLKIVDLPAQVSAARELNPFDRFVSFRFVSWLASSRD